MPVLIQGQLDLPKCPHCAVDLPTLVGRHACETTDYANQNKRIWGTYACSRCGGLVVAASTAWGKGLTDCFPQSPTVDEALPEKARAYLKQAMDSLHAPAGAVMLSASAVDAMLKVKGYVKGSLYERIDAAVSDHLITPDMAKWAHEVRLDANDQRHADQAAALPTTDDARKCVYFAVALGQFMFALPARVQRGLQNAREVSTP